MYGTNHIYPPGSGGTGRAVVGHRAADRLDLDGQRPRRPGHLSDGAFEAADQSPPLCGGAAGAGLGGPGGRQLLQGLEEIRLGPAAPAVGGGGPRGGPSAGAGGEPCAGGGAGPAGAIPPGGVPAVLRGIRAGGDRDVDGLHGQSGQHVSLPGQGKIAEHAGRRLWTGMLIRVSWTRYSSRKRGGPP